MLEQVLSPEEAEETANWSYPECTGNPDVHWQRFQDSRRERHGKIHWGLHGTIQEFPVSVAGREETVPEVGFHKLDVQRSNR